MSRSFWRTLLALAAVAALLGISACGGDDNESSDSGTPAQSDEGSTASGGESVTDKLFAGTAVDNIADPAQGKKGGKLTVLSGGDVDYMDPGKTYYTYAIGIMNMIHRGLYVYTPQDPSKPVPDLAEGEPEISADGKTVTVKLKHGVMFSKPVSREVEAKDVKYAHRARLHGQRPNGYARVYLGDLEGAPKKPGDYQEIPGIETPDKYTLVLQAHEGHRRGRRGRARRCRSRSRSRRSSRRSTTRRPRRPTATRPRSTPARTWSSPTRRARRSATWPARRIDLVRNPDYAPVDDFRPAYLDEIEFQAGNDDTAVATRRILSGESLAGGDIEPPSRQLKAAAGDQQAGALGGAGRWLAHDLDGHQPSAVRRHQRPQGRRSRASTASPPASSAAARRSARSPRATSRRAWPGSRSRAASRAAPTPRTGWRSRRATATCRPSTSRRPAWPRASTRAARRS